MLISKLWVEVEGVVQKGQSIVLYAKFKIFRIGSGNVVRNRVPGSNPFIN